MKQGFAALVATGMIFCYSAVLAGENIPEQGLTLEPVTVTAHALPDKVSATPGGVGIVKAETIGETAPVSLTDVAARIPGVEKTSESIWGGDINIRGLGRDSVVYMIDGIRVNVTTDINGRFGLVNPEDIERIEILKGPISALYGSGSTGGVVNIITKKGEFEAAPVFHYQSSLGAGTNPAGGQVHQMFSFNGPESWYWGSLGYRNYTDFRNGDGESVHNSGYKDLSGKLATGFNWNAQNVTTLQYQHLEGSEIGIPGTGMAPLPTNADVTLAHNDRHLLDLSHSFKPENSWLTESTFQLSYQSIQRRVRIDNFNSGLLSSVRPAADHNTLAGSWENVLTFSDQIVVIGVDAWNWHMDSSRVRTTRAGTSISDLPTPKTDQTSIGLYGEDAWRISRDWTIRFGLRSDYVRIDNEKTENIDENTVDDTNWSGNIGLTWHLADSWSMTTIASSSYRTPNILERFKNINLGGGVTEVGNPGLDPERAMFFEYGISYTGRNVHASAAVFYNEINDYIVPEYISPTLYRMGNVSEAALYGAELSMEWHITPEWTILGNMAYTEGRDETADEWLRFIAPLNGLFGVKQKTDSGWWWTVEVQWAAKQTHVPQDIDESDAWAVTNVRVGYDFPLAGLQHSVLLGVTNLFDKSYSNYLATSRGIELHEPGLNASLTWKVMF